MSDATSQVEESAGGLTELDEFSDMLKQKIKPRGKVAETEVDNAVVSLVQEALGDNSLIADDVIDTLDAILAKLDEQLTVQVNEIIHNEEFQKLESSWRGLAYTLDNTRTDSSMKIKVFNASKDELNAQFRQYRGDKWITSPLYKKIFQEELGTLGGKPYGCLVGDYHFGMDSPDVTFLREISRIAAVAHAPFISAASPELLGMDSYNEMDVPDDIGSIFDRPEYAKWNGMRESENSRYLALTLPRVLAREPYSQNTNSVVEEFNFEEETDGHDGMKYGWMNSAHAMAVNINRAHKAHGWTVQIRGVQSGGEVLNLPSHTFDTGDGGKDLKCPTEVAIPDSREKELSDAGLIGLLHRKNTDKAAFIGAQTLYKPTQRMDAEATASDNLSSRLPYIFAVSRFSHFLKCMMRDKIGKSDDRIKIEKDLQTWINKYVHANPETANDLDKAKKPLAGAKVEVIEDEENPGYYTSNFYLKPHFQLEGVNVGMSLVSKIPNGK
ncbi:MULTISPECIES: type VI secretion system contractile sheath large subunit [Ascidiaceihabitans]|uniref:Type VI secretion system contractile sheath large subunit n=1 Tax=Ascidiaceihabitans donghaensis TaxID=1510460 RepID=A0A2R8BPF7_9RHOB|nr:type VI secretion system contractile sheath large subunit [Ascidiaceihabitans donghaensis]SPH27498.1 hypothetical protein ASD8599_03964 [Ascidiaceihabitans donghaensis]